ncbi:serine hydrolase [Frankia sp. QA3]|uniref:serine hydrolase n=1 Tax=Frankia sp. QA3 TaxID=710111 RepID=UPI0002DA2144|nr:serine hydrolase [Frankia sp. QA3]
MVLLTVTSVAGGAMYWPAGEATGSAGAGGSVAAGVPATVSATAAGDLEPISPALVRRRVEAAGTQAPSSVLGTALRPTALAVPEPRTVVEPIAAARGAASTGLAARFRRYLAGRPGHVSVAMYDAVAGTTAVYTDPAVAGYETASSVKLDILTALVQRAGASGRLTAREQALARRMISVSDNAAASALWADVGGAPAMNAFFARLGMHATTAGPGGKWGLTRTTGADQLAVLRALSYPGTLSAAGRAVVSGLLKTVIPAQRWGLTGGVPAGVRVELKNGWLPRTSGWVITSLAHVRGAGRDYVMAVYTKNGPTMRSGITTVQGLSALAWQAARASAAVG